MKKLSDNDKWHQKCQKDYFAWVPIFEATHQRPPTPEEETAWHELWVQKATSGVSVEVMRKSIAKSRRVANRRAYTKAIPRDEDGELFGDNWKAHGILTPEGPVPNAKATAEQIASRTEASKRRIKRAEEQLEADEARQSVLEPGFSMPGIIRAEQALEVLGLAPENSGEDQSKSADHRNIGLSEKK